MRNWISLVALLLFGALSSPPQTAAGRYVYVVTCGARVDKLDTIAEKKSRSFDLAKSEGNERLIPVVQGALDGCLTYQAIYDANASSFYTIAPVQAEPKADGTKDYRILEFSIPALRLVKSFPAGSNQDNPPHLVFTAAAREPRAIPAAEWSPRTDLDLSEYAPDHAKSPNQILETSGAAALLRMFTANPRQLAFAVANRQTKALIRLREVPSTVAPDVHLAPGGNYVLIEETTPEGEKAAKTGKLALFDAATGKAVEALSNPVVKRQYYLAITPDGKAIYHSGEDYSFIGLSKTFAVMRVIRPAAPASDPGVFFADR